MFPCASAHRETRWNWSEVATMVSGYDPKVLSQELSHILSQTLSQMSYNFDRSAQKKKKTVALPKSGHYLILRTLALCQDSGRDSTDELASAYDPEDEAASDSDPEDRTKSNEYLGRVDSIVFCERWRYRRLETYRILRALARAKSGNYRILRVLARANSGNYRILRAW